MSNLRTCASLALLALTVFALFSCSVEVGSEEWCATMKEKSKADWTANEAADFAKHCIFK